MSVILKAPAEQVGTAHKSNPQVVETVAAVLDDIRANGDAVTKKVAESFVSAFNLLRQRTEGTDMPFLVAREKYIKYS